MSRSIHTTRKSVREMSRARFSDPSQKAEALSIARQSLHTKRAIKRQTMEERRRASEVPGAGSTEFIPIEFLTSDRNSHPVVDVGDLRAILRGLPVDATSGLARIQIGLGREYIESSEWDGEPERDPFTGRISVEIMPGVWAGCILGTYSENGLVRLYTYVYDAEVLPLPGPLLAIYLRLQMLSTLVHECAHHHDHICRRGRGRWLARRRGLVESYAESMEFKWTREVVIPYLEKRYPSEISQLSGWVEHHGGLKPSIEFFAAEGQRTLKDGGRILRYETTEVFESLVGEVAKGASLRASRLHFAWELHYADRYEACLEVLDGIQGEDPGNLEALVCRADTFLHLDRLDEAMTTALAVLNVEPGNLDALEVQARVYEQKRDWERMLDTSRNLFTTSEEGSSSRFRATYLLAIACCALGDMEQTEAWIQARASFNGKSRNEQVIRRMVFRRAGKETPEHS